MLIIFDCDGVLIDSEILSAQVDAEVLAEIGYAITPEEVVHRFAGLTTERIFQLAGEEMGRTVPEAVIERAKRETDRKLKAEVLPIAGVQEMLDALDDPRCICSNSRPERLEVSLDESRAVGPLPPLCLFGSGRRGRPRQAGARRIPARRERRSRPRPPRRL